MAGTALRLPRSRGAFSGGLLILLGLWGALVPLIGPYLHYAYTPDRAWVVTSGRVWLEFLPGALAVIGGILMVTSKYRPTAISGAVLGGLSGAWFAFGGHLARMIVRNPPAQGIAVGGPAARTAEQLGFFSGLGVVMIFVAAIAVGRLSVVSTRDLKFAERLAARAEAPARVEAPASAIPASVGSGTADGEVTDRTAKRKAPLATLTKIATGRKPAGADSSAEVTRPREEVGSGT